MSYELVEILRGAGHPRLLVVGDLVLDRYTWADAERISQEAPVMLLREDRRECRLGGAANVANMLRGLEAEVVMAGVVGDDEDGREAECGVQPCTTSAAPACAIFSVRPSLPP